MSTRAEVEVIAANGKAYIFWIHRDAHPESVFPDFPETSTELEEIRRALYLEDFPESCPDYYFIIDLQKSFIKIYGHKYNAETKEWRRGRLQFKGSIEETKTKYS